MKKQNKALDAQSQLSVAELTPAERQELYDRVNAATKAHMDAQTTDVCTPAKLANDGGNAITGIQFTTPGFGGAGGQASGDSQITIFSKDEVILSTTPAGIVRAANEHAALNAVAEAARQDRITQDDGVSTELAEALDNLDAIRKGTIPHFRPQERDTHGISADEAIRQDREGRNQ